MYKLMSVKAEISYSREPFRYFAFNKMSLPFGCAALLHGCFPTRSKLWPQKAPIVQE